MIDGPSMGFTWYEESETSTIRWIKVEDTHLGWLKGMMQVVYIYIV